MLLRTPATTRSTKRARSHGAPSMTTLSDDALLEIFARLPAKSVGRLRCVSRSWAATLKSAPFVDLHLREANNRRQQPTPKLFFTTADPENRWHLDVVLTKPCHGLVLIRRLPYYRHFVCNRSTGALLPHHRHFVCNPSTGALLPLSDSYQCRRRNGEAYGLGYSPATKEHKVVRLFSSSRSTPRCEVFSLDVSAHWRAVARQSPPSRVAVRDDPAVFCDGYLHFLQLRKHGGSIVTFDVGDETFGSLSTPPSAEDCDGPPELTVLGGRLCLCLFHDQRPRSDADPYCIWRLACRESGQWEKLYRVLHPQTLRPELDLLRVHWVSPLQTYLAGNGQKIMFATEEGVLEFDLEGGGVPEVLVSPAELVSAGDDEEATITRGTVGLLEESLVPVGRTSEEVVFSSPWRKAWSDVLKWMPAQSVAALTCVCREWRAVAESGRFVRTHALHANLGRSPGVMLVRPFIDVLNLYPLELCQSLQVQHDMALPFLFDHRESRTVCSTPCHGLVLVSHTQQVGSVVVDFNHFICNPTMEYSSRIGTDTLDDGDDDDSPNCSAAGTMGLGYDSRTNKHVLARLVVVRRRRKGSRHYRPVKVKCHVQLVGATAWIPISPPPRPPAVDVQPAHADGKLYWMVDDDDGSRCELLALDVGTREFEVLPGPPYDRGRITSIVELQGNVCVLCSDTGANAIDVWKRLEGGSWSAAWLCRVELGEFRRMYPSEETTLLAVDPKDGRVLLSTGRALGYYDPEARALQTVYSVGEHLQDMRFAPMLCHESLIRPRTY